MTPRNQSGTPSPGPELRSNDSERGFEIEAGAWDFEALYDAHFDFVWRSARRLGAEAHALDDVVQEVFLVAYRKLPEFLGRSSLKTWLFGITLRVVRAQRRRAASRAAEPLPDGLADDVRPGPGRSFEQRQALELLHRLLDRLDDPKREVFVLAELEEFSAPEIAEALGVNLNTVYSRLRAARSEMDAALKRVRAEEAWTERER
ncbi:MAG: RNA polymerase sigma factor [Polyangiaceae bacterium]|nr:RNA polymerase sigma factor [Polyangiaceae bacterium]MCB9610370.1 RNA polymerase sigma factor [Polyangiaceae bacterium]